MTLIDLIKLGLNETDAAAEKFAADFVAPWHEDLIPGELNDVLGLTPREYQAWTTGGVSLLTIAQWHQNRHPALDVNRPWFKLSGTPGKENVGYLEGKIRRKKKSLKRPVKSTSASGK